MADLSLPELCSVLVNALVLDLKTPGCHLETATCIWFLAYEASGSDRMRASLEKFQLDLMSMENEHCGMMSLSPACVKCTPPSSSQPFRTDQLLVTSPELSFNCWQLKRMTPAFAFPKPINGLLYYFPLSLLHLSILPTWLLTSFSPSDIPIDFWTPKHTGHMEELKHIILVPIPKYFYVQEI